MRRAQSKMFALTDDAPAVPLPRQEAPGGHAGSSSSLQNPDPVEAPPVGKTAVDVQKEAAPRRKSVDEAAQAMVDAMNKKAAAKEAKDAKEAKEAAAQGKTKAKAKAKAKAKGENAKAEPAQKHEKVKAEAAKGTKRKADIKDEPEVKIRNPQIGHEASRSQYLCRTGLGGKGQSVAFQYTKAKGSQQAAQAKADKWLANEKNRRGIA